MDFKFAKIFESEGESALSDSVDSERGDKMHILSLAYSERPLGIFSGYLHAMWSCFKFLLFNIPIGNIYRADNYCVSMGSH